MTKKRREKIQISKIRNANGEITTNTMEIQGIIRNYIQKNLNILKKWENV
jgi:hypothetical protein